MSLLESIILLLIIGSILLGGGLYYALTRKPVKKLTMHEPARKLPADDFELSTALFPDRPVEYIPELPDRYEETRFTAMVRDPYWIYAYWDIADTHQNQLWESYGLDHNSSNYIIRIHDITENQLPGIFFDLPVNIQAREWFVHVGTPDRMFQLELGALVNGNFVLIVRSNQVKTPRDFLSDKIDPDWMLAEDLQCKLYAKAGPPGPSSPGQWQQPGSQHLFPQKK